MKQKDRRKNGETADGKHSFPILDMIRDLPTAPAPRNFERVLYRRLGITYVPLHRKVLILSGSSVFAGFVYFAGRRLFGMLAPKVTLVSVARFISLSYSKIMQAAGVVKAGYHLREIVIAFTNPWFLVGVAFVSSALMLLLIAIVKNGKKSAVLLSNH